MCSSTTPNLDTARLTYQRLSSDPFGQLLEPLDLKRFHTLRIPRRYLIVTEDTVTPPGGMGMASATVQQARHLPRGIDEHGANR
jgi:hypothetical protein